MSINAINDKIIELQEKLNIINQSEKDRVSQKEAIKEELRKLLLQVDATAEAESEEMKEAAQQLQNDIEKTEAERKRKEAKEAEVRARLHRNIEARIKAAQKIDIIIKELNKAVRRHLEFALETEGLIQEDGLLPRTGLMWAKRTISEILRFVFTDIELLGTCWVPPAERVNFTMTNKEKSILHHYLP